MMTTYLYTCLKIIGLGWIIFLLPFTSRAQVKVYYEILDDNTGNYSEKNISIDPKIKVSYLKKNLLVRENYKKWAKRDINGRNVIVIDKDEAIIELEFDKKLFDQGYRFTASLSGNGSIIPMFEGSTSLLDANNRYLRYTIQKAGKGSFSYKIVNVQENTRPRKILPKSTLASNTYTFNVVLFENETKTLRILNQKKDTVRYIEKMAEFYQAFSILKEGDHRKNTFLPVVGQLGQARSELGKFHKIFQDAAEYAKPERVKDYYEAFKGLKNYPIFRTYYDQAFELLKHTDQILWTDLAAKGNYLSLDLYLCTFCQPEQNLSGFNCAYQKQAEEGIYQILERELKQESDYCNFETLLDGLNCYNTRKLDKLVATANRECADQDCSALYKNASQVSRGSNPSLINQKRKWTRVLNNCSKYSAEARNALDVINKEIQCDNDFVRAKNETDDRAKKGMLEELRDYCPKYLEEVTEMLSYYLPPVIASMSPGPVKPGENPTMDIKINSLYRALPEKAYYFEFDIEEGAGIEFSFDEVQDSLLILEQAREKIFSLQLEEDKKYIVVVLDGEAHKVNIKSVGGDAPAISLSPQKYELLLLTESEDLLNYELQAGESPYTFEFSRGKRKYFYIVDQRKGSIPKVELMNFEPGLYKIAIRDLASRRIEANYTKTTLDKITIPAESRLSLWMFLILPLILISGFLIYRNLGKQM